MEGDRRKSIRIHKQFTAQYYNSARDAWNMTTVRDISTGGICINTDVHFTPGDIISLRLKLPTSPFNWMELHARVVESMNMLARLEFHNPTDEQKQLILDCVDWFLKTEGGKG